jgi:hypothetical protein
VLSLAGLRLCFLAEKIACFCGFAKDHKFQGSFSSLPLSTGSRLTRCRLRLTHHYSCNVVVTVDFKVTASTVWILMQGCCGLQVDAGVKVQRHLTGL